MSDMEDALVHTILVTMGWSHDRPAPSQVEKAKELARAVLSTMQEPTPEMRLASKRYKRTAKVYSGPECYRRMIDAALPQPGGSGN